SPSQLLQEPHAAVMGIAGGVAPEVFDEKWHPLKRPGWWRMRVLDGLVETRLDDRIELRIEPLDAVDCPLDELGRGDVAPAHRGRLAHCVEVEWVACIPWVDGHGPHRNPGQEAPEPAKVA